MRSLAGVSSTNELRQIPSNKPLKSRFALRPAKPVRESSSSRTLATRAVDPHADIGDLPIRWPIQLDHLSFAELDVGFGTLLQRPFTRTVGTATAD